MPWKKSSRCPKLFGHSKTDTADTLLRSVSDKEIVKYLGKYLQPNNEKPRFYSINLTHLVDILSNIRINKRVILVSFDVVTFFTNIPVSEAIETI